MINISIDKYDKVELNFYKNYLILKFELIYLKPIYYMIEFKDLEIIEHNYFLIENYFIVKL